MTVENVTSEISFNSNGVTTNFPFVFRVDDISWLNLSFNDDLDEIVLNADQDASPGGSVIFLVAPPAGQQVILTRHTPLTQLLDYTRYDPFDSEAHESALDKLTMMFQDRNLDTARKSKSITVEQPTSSEDLGMFYTPVAIEVSEIQAVLVGSSSPSVTWTIRYDNSRSDTGLELVSGGTTTTSVTTGDNVTEFADGTIPADSFVWLETTAQSGVVQSMHITIRYTETLP